MKIFPEVIRTIDPSLGKNELLLALLLLDLCDSKDGEIEKYLVKTHPFYTITMKSKKIITDNINGKEILFDKDYDGEKIVLFEEISKSDFKYHVKLSEKIKNKLKRSNVVEIDPTLFKHFTKPYEIRFLLWIKAWEEEKEKTVNIDIFQKYLHKSHPNAEFMKTYVKKMLSKLLLHDIIVHVTSNRNKNDKRYVESLTFRIVS